MNATQTKLVSSFVAFIEAGESFGVQMKAYAEKHDLTPDLLQSLADVVAVKFDCYVKVTNRGSVGFYQDAEGKVRHDAARKCWQRNVGVWIKPESKPATRKQVDKVQATATRLQKQLNKKELARLIKLLSE